MNGRGSKFLLLSKIMGKIENFYFKISSLTGFHHDFRPLIGKYIAFTATLTIFYIVLLRFFAKSVVWTSVFSIMAEMAYFTAVNVSWNSVRSTITMIIFLMGMLVVLFALRQTINQACEVIREGCK